MTELPMTPELHKLQRDRFRGENTNQLDEVEWRTIHNGLRHYLFMFSETHRMRKNIQKLMDKVRDLYIAPYTEVQDESPE